MDTEPLRGRSALVIGGATGIGAAITRALHKEGARVVFTYCGSWPEAEALSHELGLRWLQMDVADADNMKGRVEYAAGILRGLDILVYNAGCLDVRDHGLIQLRDYDRVADINARGAFFAIQEASRLMESGGSIVTIGSLGAQIGGIRSPHYAAAKGALHTMTKSFARLLAKRGIRVNTVAPGFVRTKLMADVLEREEEQILSRIPLGRLQEPEDIANAVLFLVSSLSSAITGQCLNVNGGEYLG